MRIATITAFSALILSVPALAYAQGGAIGKPPAIGTTNPTPPTAGGEAVPPPIDQPAAPSVPNTALGTSRDAPKPTAPTGIDTSTAAPGGQAESSKNGALSSPPPADSDKASKHLKKHKTGVSPEADTKS